MCITETYMINDANKLSEKASSVNGRVILPYYIGTLKWPSRYTMGRLTGVASKVENILKGSLDLIPSPSTMVFKVWVGKFV